MNDTHDVERDLLTIMLDEPHALGHLNGLALEPSDFLITKYRSAYAAIKTIYDRGDSPGLESVRAEMDNTGTLAHLEPGELEEIAAQIVGPDQMSAFARQIKAASLRRKAVYSAEHEDYEAASELKAEADALISGDETEPDVVTPEFPVDALPLTVRKLVTEGAAASDVPPEMVALPVLGITAALIGAKASLRIKRSWIEYPRLWLAIIAEPGRGKTPAERHARIAIERIQKEAHDAFELDKSRYEAQLADWNEARGFANKPKRPVMTDYFMDDVTMEGLAAALVVQPGIAVLQDELTSWVAAHDAYRGGKGGDRGKWLKLWSGATVKVNRKTGDPILVTDHAVSVAGGIQPDMLPTLAEDRGRRDGYIERILYSWPDDHIPDDDIEDDISAETENAYIEQARRIVNMKPLESPVQFTNEARARWVEWKHHNRELQMEASGLLGGIYSKLTVQLARVALVLHVLESTEDGGGFTTSTTFTGSALPLEALEGAIRIVEYFRDHAHKVVPHFGGKALNLGSPEQEAAVSYLEKHGNSGTGEVAEAIGVAVNSASRTLKRLHNRGAILNPSYGRYAPMSESTSGESGESGETGTGRCSTCGSPTDPRTGLCERDDCGGLDPHAEPLF